MAKNKLTINFNLRFNSKTGKPLRLKEDLDKVGQFLFEDVAIAQSNNLLDSAAIASVEARVIATVRTEVDRLAGYMLKGIVDRSPSATGPVGNLRVAESAAVGNPQLIGSLSARPFSVSSISPPWQPRSAQYLKRKGREFGHTNWFQRRGILGKFLGSGDRLLASLGPITVAFIKNNGRSRLTGRFERTSFSRGSGPAAVTAGTPGRNPSYVYRAILGRIEVSVFGKITPQMLPGLLSGDPGNLAPGDATGLTALLPRDVRYRLDPADGKPYRMTIEPYLSWFLTRAIPFAVLRRLSADFKTRAEGGGRSGTDSRIGSGGRSGI